MASDCGGIHRIKKRNPWLLTAFFSLAEIQGMTNSEIEEFSRIHLDKDSNYVSNHDLRRLLASSIQHAFTIPQ